MQSNLTVSHNSVVMQIRELRLCGLPALTLHNWLDHHPGGANTYTEYDQNYAALQYLRILIFAEFSR